MPNHVTTICTVTGTPADVAAFVEKHIVPVPERDGARFFDFSTVIPKPDVVTETTSGSKAEVGLYALTGWMSPKESMFYDNRSELDRHNPSARWRYLPPSLDTREKLLAHLKENDPEALSQGEKAKRCLDATGHPDWYEWSIANWGTKWGAYDFEERERGDGRYVFEFQTAWSVPRPILRKLAEMYPGLVFDLASFDEVWNFGAVGQINGRNDFRIDRELATAELYERVYGRKPDLDEDDEATPTGSVAGGGS